MQTLKSSWVSVAVMAIMTVLVFFAYREYTRESCGIFAPTIPLQSQRDIVEVVCKESDADESGRPVLGYLSYKPELKKKLKELIQRKAPALDEELVSFVKKVMDPPAPSGNVKMSRSLALTPQAKEIDKLLNQKSKGFYIEAGANDGERSSNTIWFEEKRHWTGLLVEPDPFFYTQLMGKNRHAWSINGCLSPYDYVSEIAFTQSTGGSGKLELGPKTSQKFKVPCYPLKTLLSSLSVTHVDYFSLDVEGAEGVVLESIPFDKVNISTLSVEYRHGDKQRYIEIMKANGYEMVKDLVEHNEAIALWVDDFIFVKKGTKKPT